MRHGKNQKAADNETRNDLTGEHFIGDAGQLILFFLFIISWVTDAFILHISDSYSSFLPWTIRIILAVIIFIAGAWLAKAGLNIVFGEVRETPSVIRKGVFNIVRHPIYLGTILFYIGLLVVKFSIITAAIFCLIVIFYHLISLHEEKLLTQRFGDEYQQYKTVVPMWIPRCKIGK